MKTDFARFGITVDRMSRNVTKSDTPLQLDIIAQRIMRTAVKMAPVLTGALRASGRVKRTNQFQRVIQFGGSGTGVDYATFIEYGTFRTRPQPFLRPAVLKHKKEMTKRFNVAIGIRFDQVAKQFPPGRK